FLEGKGTVLVMNHNLITALFGLAASLSWGSGDFSGGLATRRANVLTVVVAAHAIGLILLIALALAWSEPFPSALDMAWGGAAGLKRFGPRSEEHTSELQSRGHLVCRLLLEKKKGIRP